MTDRINIAELRWIAGKDYRYRIDGHDVLALLDAVEAANAVFDAPQDLDSSIWRDAYYALRQAVERFDFGEGDAT